MDINEVVLTGRVFGMGYNPYKNRDYGVAEGKVSVMVGRFGPNKEPSYEEFYIRSYGQKALVHSELEDGTYVTLKGRLREDVRVNSGEPDKARSKTYVNIDSLKVMKNYDGEEEDE